MAIRDQNASSTGSLYSRLDIKPLRVAEASIIFALDGLALGQLSK